MNINPTDLRTQIPLNELTDRKPPAYGAPQRDAINSVVDNIVGDICRDVGELRIILDEIEQRVLENAANVKHYLAEHVGICVGIKDEVTHIKRVVEDIRQRADR